MKKTGSQIDFQMDFQMGFQIDFQEEKKDGIHIPDQQYTEVQT